MPGLEIASRAPNFIAEVRGLDVGESLSPETIAQLRAAWVHYKVLVLPFQDITDEQQVAFSRKLGALEEFPLNAVRSNAQREIVGRQFWLRRSIAGSPSASASDIARRGDAGSRTRSSR